MKTSVIILSILFILFTSCTSSSQQVQPDNTVEILLTSNNPDKPEPEKYLLNCTEVYLARGSYGGLQMNFYSQESDSDSLYLEIHLPYVEEFYIEYQRQEDYHYEFSTGDLQFPIKVDSSHFQDLFTFFEVPLKAYFWVSVTYQHKTTQNIYSENFSLTVDSLFFHGDSINFYGNFQANTLDDELYPPYVFSGNIKVVNFPTDWMMVD
ncbi:MAG: hypothetical protein APR63_13555 [Desulfuromonas sp. SDB]|nr:MAG: hypothetical protein APR63_13555 [Desulfuromonas sp. SDB]